MQKRTTARNLWDRNWAQKYLEADNLLWWLLLLVLRKPRLGIAAPHDLLLRTLRRRTAAQGCHKGDFSTSGFRRTFRCRLTTSPTRTMNPGSDRRHLQLAGIRNYQKLIAFILQERWVIISRIHVQCWAPYTNKVVASDRCDWELASGVCKIQ